MNIQDVGLKFKPMDSRSTSSITTLFLHHSDGHGTIQQVHQEHLDRGWSGCGYNNYVRQDGSVWKGRGIEFVPAGVLGHNSNSIHICVEGNLMIENITAGQVVGVKNLIDYYKKMLPNLKICLGHKEVMATDCPGKNYPLADIKKYFTSSKGTSTPTKPTILTGSMQAKTVTASSLNVRSGGGLNFPIVGSLKKGSVVRIGKVMSNGWTNIYFGNHGGFVSSQYLK